jgi:basic amino acid/polyamine antiporter, APA family
VITIAGAVLLYVAVAFVAVGVVGSAAMADTAAPLHVAAQAFGGNVVPVLIAIGGVTAMLGVILSQLLGLSRMSFAMARRNDLPRFLEQVHPRYGVPGRATVAIGALAAVVAATATLRSVAAAASFAILIYYWITNFAAIRMQERKIVPDAVPITGLIACTVLAASLAPRMIATGTAILALGLLARALVRRRT